MKYRVLPLKRELSRLSWHLVEILDGALTVLADSSNPMRFSFATQGLRELLRELLAHLAPDDKIKKSKWYKPDPSAATGITRKHRTTFSVYGFVDPKVLPKALARDVNALAKNISDHVERLSSYCHVTKATLAKPASEVDALVESTIDLFQQLLKTINESQEILIDELQMALTGHIDDIFINDFFDELDILSTHTRPTGAWDVEATITDIDENRIYFTGTGSVSCDLQYGSDGDCRRGDGVEWSNSFPFTFEGSANVAALNDAEVERESVQVDTSSYYE